MVLSFLPISTQPGQTCEAPVGAWFAPLAYSLIMLRGDGVSSRLSAFSPLPIDFSIPECSRTSSLVRTSQYPSVFLGDLVGCKSDPPVEPITQLADFIRARKWFACTCARYPTIP